jgi:hypothetical protein
MSQNVVHITRPNTSKIWVHLLWACCLLLLLGATAVAAGLRCNVCGQAIQGRFIKAGDQAFCSRACYLKTLPTCSVCGKPLEGKYLVADNHKYCSQACLNTVLPKCTICGQPLSEVHMIGGKPFCKEHAESPRCSRCGLPFASGIELADERLVCDDCNQGLIFQLKEAEEIYRKARADVRQVTGLLSPSLPELQLVGLDVLREKNDHQPNPGMTQHGLYNRQVEVTKTTDWRGRVRSRSEKVTETVYILYGLSPEEFAATAAHELTHDLIAEFFPQIPQQAPKWVEEGICQYVSAMVCLRNGYFEEVRSIENNKDRDYGGGYRYFQRAFGDARWQQLTDWIGRTSMRSLPPEPPAAGTITTGRR